MIKDLLINVVNVIDRQYKTYFTLIINNEIEEITRSASLNNINLEEIIGMFIAKKHKATNASVKYISSQIKCIKNKVIDYLNNLPIQSRD